MKPLFWFLNYLIPVGLRPRKYHTIIAPKLSRLGRVEVRIKFYIGVQFFQKFVQELLDFSRV